MNVHTRAVNLPMHRYLRCNLYNPLHALMQPLLIWTLLMWPPAQIPPHLQPLQVRNGVPVLIMYQPAWGLSEHTFTPCLGLLTLSWECIEHSICTVRMTQTANWNNTTLHIQLCCQASRTLPTSPRTRPTPVTTFSSTAHRKPVSMIQASISSCVCTMLPMH